MTTQTTDLKSAIFHAQSLIDQGDYLAGENQAREILRVIPGEINAQRVLGSALRLSKNYREAATCLNTVIRQAPKFALAHQELGLTYTATGDTQQAIKHLVAATELDAGLPAAWQSLAKLYAQLGDEIKSQQAVEQQLKYSGHPPELVEALQHFQGNRIAKSEAIVREYLKTHPTDVSAIRLLGEIAIKLKLYTEAENLLERALELAPDYHQARLNYATALQGRQRSAEALEQLEILSASSEPNPAYLTLKASCQASLGDSEGAIKTYKYLCSDFPKQARILLSMGHTYKALGEQDNAIACYREAIELDPNVGEAYWSLANLKTFKFSDDELANMKTLASGNQLARDDAFHLAFALGKAYEDLKDYDKSFKYYARGNEIRRPTEPYSADANHQDIQRMIEISSPAFFADRSSYGCNKADPIFILGLPRSGSTLIEQILSSHSQVDGTKELPDIISIARRLSGRKKKTDASKYPEVLAELTPEQCIELGEEYLERAAPQRGTAPLFIDKMPNNFMHISLIKLILPNAKIIDARRHPMAACFGGFKQLFASGQRFSYSQTDIARYYRDYVSLMDQLNEAIPGAIHRVNYEQMVDDTEAQIRALLDYCGLPFEEQCLRFYETKRSVRTASSEQVRQPIYKSAVALWKEYEGHLSPMLEILNDEMTRYENELITHRRS